jgi:CRISPR/Cas system CMR-associated protein Cmr3 (group 5 of RAMP superfamily)
MKKIIIVLTILICSFLGYFFYNYSNGWETDFPVDKKVVKTPNSKLVWIDYVIRGPTNAG